MAANYTSCVRHSGRSCARVFHIPVVTKNLNLGSSPCFQCVYSSCLDRLRKGTRVTIPKRYRRWGIETYRTTFGYLCRLTPDDIVFQGRFVITILRLGLISSNRKYREGSYSAVH